MNLMTYQLLINTVQKIIDWGLGYLENKNPLWFSRDNSHYCIISDCNVTIDQCSSSCRFRVTIILIQLWHNLVLQWQLGHNKVDRW